MNALHGRSVKILSGLQEFIGKTGTIVNKEEHGMYRIRLNSPVMVPGVGEVRDDIWERSGFKLLRD